MGARLPTQTAPGQTYGVASQQRAAQQVVPLRAPTAVQPPAAAVGPPPPSPPPLMAPTERPDEPLTTGLGPVDLPAAPSPPMNLSAADAEALRSRLPLLEFMASQPGAAPSTRLFAFRVRSMLGD